VVVVSAAQFTPGKLSERQRGLLLAFKDTHDQGVKSPPYYQPFGVTRLTLGGEGSPMAGLIKRGLVEERDNLFYLTENGLKAANAVAALLASPGINIFDYLAEGEQAAYAKARGGHA
jgi:hypothetical protein